MKLRPLFPSQAGTLFGLRPGDPSRFIVRFPGNEGCVSCRPADLSRRG